MKVHLKSWNRKANTEIKLSVRKQKLGKKLVSLSSQNYVYRIYINLILKIKRPTFDILPIAVVSKMLETVLFLNITLFGKANIDILQFP